MIPSLTQRIKPSGFTVTRLFSVLTGKIPEGLVKNLEMNFKGVNPQDVSFNPQAGAKTLKALKAEAKNGNTEAANFLQLLNKFFTIRK